MAEREINVRLIANASQYLGEVGRAETATGRLRATAIGAGQAFGNMGGVIGSTAVGAIVSFGTAAIKAAEGAKQMELQVGAILAANKKYTDSSGQVVKGIRAINLAQGDAAKLFAQIEKDAGKSQASVQELVQNFAVALPAALAKGLDAGKTQKAVVQLTDAMKVLQIDAGQAKSEMRALFSGDVNQDSDLAKSLFQGKASKEIKAIIQESQRAGTFFDLLTEKTASFSAASAKNAQSLTGVTSNIKDMGNQFLKVVGQGALPTLTAAANTFKSALDGDKKGVGGLSSGISALAKSAGADLAAIIVLAAQLGAAFLQAAAAANRAQAAIKTVGAAAREAGTQTNLFYREQANKLRQALPFNPASRAGAQRAGEGLARERADFQQSRAARRAESAAADKEAAALQKAASDLQLKANEMAAPKRKKKGAAKGGLVKGGIKGVDSVDISAQDGELITDNKLTKGLERLVDMMLNGSASLPSQLSTPKAGSRAIGKAKDDVVGAQIDALREVTQWQERLNDAFDGGSTGKIKVLENYLAQIRKLPGSHKEVAAQIKATEQELVVERLNQMKALDARQDEQMQRQASSVSFQIRLNEQLKGGDDGRLKILDDYVTSLKGLPRQTKATQDEIAQVEQDIQIQRIEMARRSADELTAINQAITAANADEEGQRIDQVLDETRRGNDEAIRDLERRYDQNRITAEDYYTQLTVLRQQDVAAEAAAEQKKLALQRQIVTQRLALENAKAKGERSGTVIVQLQSTLNQLEATQAAISSRAKSDGDVIAKRNAERLADETQARVKDALGLAIDAVFTGDLSSISNAFKDNAKKGIIQALADSSIGKSLGGLLGGAGGIGGAIGGLLIGGFIDLVTGSFREIARRGEVEQSIKAELAGLAERSDPTAEISKRFSDIRKSIAERRTSTVKFLGIPLFSKRGGVNPDEEAFLTAQEAKEKTEAVQAQSAQAVQDTIRKLGLLRQLGERSAAQVVGELQKILRTANLSEEEVLGLRIQLKGLQEEMKQEAEQKAQEFQSSWEQAVGRVQDAFGRMTERVSKDLDTLISARERASKSASQRDQLLSIAGLTSESAGQLNDLSRRISDSSVAAGRASGIKGQSGKTLDRIKGLLGGNLFAGGTSNFIGKTDFNDIGNAVRNLSVISQKAGGAGAVRNANGQVFTTDQLESMAREFAQALAAEQVAAGVLDGQRDQQVDLRFERDKLLAEIEANRKETTGGLNLELQSLKAGKDPAKQADAKKAEIDAQINARKRELFNQGVFSDPTGRGDASGINDKLEEIRKLQKAELDASLQSDSFTDSSPLPVRVVEMPPAFALPSSSYFRSGAPALTIGKVEVNGSGLSATELTSAVQQAIVKAGTTLTDTVNRQNTIRNATVKLK